MDQESIVYGCIKDATDFRVDGERRQTNREAMYQLPTVDEWPYLSREMFAIPQLSINNDNYQTEVIHFGASYKAVEYEWNLWMKKFEELLNSMYWVSAVVHLETELTGVHTFTWESKNNGHEPGAGIHQVHCQWVQENSLA
ncbi:MAG: hypothetical protein COA42_02985 [Alteromonadaceae bacterium]|nr:MAG: hypothetical protein COA42_02985 [Alteromonadaceae bacterium]